MPVAALAAPWQWGPPASRLPLDPDRAPQWRVAGRASAAEGPTAGPGWSAVRGPAFAVTGWLVGGEAPALEHAELAPEGLVRRFTSADGAITERLLVPLDVPAVLWELVAADADAPLEVRLPPPSPGVILGLGGGGTAPGSAGATDRVAGRGRLALAAVTEPEAPRLWSLLASRGADGLAGHRARAIAAARDAGPQLESPDAALDAAFAWSVGEAATRGAAAESLLHDDSAADAVRALWGLRLDGATLEVAPSPPAAWRRMALHRLRVAASTVDLRFTRRPGQASLDIRVRAGGAVPLAVALPAAAAGCMLDDAAVAGPWVRFLATGDHHVAVALP